MQTRGPTAPLPPRGDRRDDAGVRAAARSPDAVTALAGALLLGTTALVWHADALARPVSCLLSVLAGAALVTTGRWIATSPHGSAGPGLACTLSGATWPLSWASVTGSGPLSYVGWLYSGLVWIPLIYVVTGFPQLHSGGRRHRTALAAVAVVVLGPLFVSTSMFSLPSWTGTSPDAWWPELFTPDRDLSEGLNAAFGLGTLVLAGWVTVLCAARLVVAVSIDRLVRLPAVVGASLSGLVAGSAVVGIEGAALAEDLTVQSAGVLLFPAAVLVSHLHLRGRRRRLLGRLAAVPSLSLPAVEGVLAHEFLDGSLRVVLWDPLRRRVPQASPGGPGQGADLFAGRTVAAVSAPAVEGGPVFEGTTIAWITADARLRAYGPLLDTAAAALSTPLALLLHAELIAAQEREANASRVRAALAAGEAVTAAEARTRASIRRDLHDGAQQRYFSLAFRLGDIAERCEDAGLPSLGAEVEQVRDDVLEATAQLREFAAGLSHVELAASVLAMAEQAPFPVRVDLAELAQAGLTGPQETTLRLAVTEALTNAIKHARATSASISCTRREGAVTVVVDDDGRGGAAAGAGGHGFQGLNDRLAELGGTVLIDSPPGRGTRIIMTFPVEVAAVEESRALRGGG